MTDPQSNRADAGQAGGVAQDHPPDRPPTVPHQAMRPEDADPDRPRADRATGSAMAGGIGGLGPAVARMAWTAALAAAIGMLAVGVLLLVWPHATLTVVAILIGAALLVAGVFRLVDGIMDRGQGGGMRAADVVIGILAIVAGLYCIKHHALTILVVALVVGAFWIIHGVGDLITAATQGKVPGRGLRVVTGLFSLAAGIVVLFWPGISLILLLTVLGAWLLFYGVVLAVLALRLRRDSKPAARSGAPAAASTA
ncbi:MAG TPA: HdeD family acid-resistance protein [Streptosporangiaceae bacterium]